MNETYGPVPTCDICGIRLLPTEYGYIDYGFGVVAQECDACLGVNN